jgi:hypothetical protein
MWFVWLILCSSLQLQFLNEFSNKQLRYAELQHATFLKCLEMDTSFHIKNMGTSVSNMIKTLDGHLCGICLLDME